jgi:hypothetical protein
MEARTGGIKLSELKKRTTEEEKTDEIAVCTILIQFANHFQFTKRKGAYSTSL